MGLFFFGVPGGTRTPDLLIRRTPWTGALVLCVAFPRLWALPKPTDFAKSVTFSIAGRQTDGRDRGAVLEWIQRCCCMSINSSLLNGILFPKSKAVTGISNTSVNLLWLKSVWLCISFMLIECWFLLLCLYCTAFNQNKVTSKPNGFYSKRIAFYSVRQAKR